MINDIRALAALVGDLSSITTSPHPDDNLFLAITSAGSADLLINGEKPDLLSFGGQAGT